MDLAADQHDYYEERLNEFGVTAKGVGWKNSAAQNIRFEQLYKLLQRQEGFSVVDIGCGLGHFAQFLLHKGCRDFTYYGYDVSEKMILEAMILNKEKGFVFKKIDSITEIKEADYCIASGIFSLKQDNSEEVWRDFILSTLETMSDKSQDGFAFNMLTKYSDPEFMEDELYYADPCFIFDYCKRKVSKDVALFHDYGEYDFTVIVRRL